MKREIEQAKNAGLNWQTLIIEEAQAEIKKAIADGVLRGEGFVVINNRIDRLVNNLVKELKSESLKQTAAQSLYRLADKLYKTAKTQGLQTDLTAAVLLLWNDDGTRRERVKAINTIAAAKGTVFDDRQSDELAKGRYWETTQPLKEFCKTYMTRVEAFFNRLSAAQAKEDYSSNVSLRNIAEMTVRQERHNKELNNLAERGIDLVWISTHGNCSKRCEPWQGKLYSLSGNRGTVDGIPYRPLSDATDIYDTTKSGKTFKNGCISGFNCRHRLIPYVKGNKPLHVSAADIEKDRKINERQRYLERGVLMYREKAMLYRGVDSKLAKKYRDKAIKWKNAYKRFSKENGVAYYPDRVKVLLDNKK